MFWCEVFIFFWINLFEVINGKPFVNFAQISDHASFGQFGAPFLPYGGPRGHFGGNLPLPHIGRTIHVVPSSNINVTICDVNAIIQCWPPSFLERENEVVKNENGCYVIVNPDKILLSCIGDRTTFIKGKKPTGILIKPLHRLAILLLIIFYRSITFVSKKHNNCGINNQGP